MSPDQAYRRKAESNRQRYIGIGIGAKFLDHNPGDEHICGWVGKIAAGVQGAGAAAGA